MSLKDHIDELKAELEKAYDLDTDLIASGVAESGFTCTFCSECCRNSCGDNTVTLFPGEIRIIMEATGLPWESIAVPQDSDDVDDRGFYHTFEWALNKKPNGDCMFLDGDGRCMAYGARPLICRTYPLRLEGRTIERYICKGLCSEQVPPERSRSIADQLKERYIRELTETIGLLEKFEEFTPSPGDIIDTGEEKTIIVHDSEGCKRIRIGMKGAYRFY